MSTQALAEVQRNPLANLRKLLDSSKTQIATALPKHLTPERMIRVALTAVQRQPKLLQCEPISIIGSIVEASQLGLEPDGILGQAYLVPFWNGKTKRLECQLQIGYRGFISLARRSGDVATLYSELVFEKDKVKITKGDTPKLEHEPNYFVEDRGELIGAYAVVVYKDGSKDWEFMPRFELDRIRDMSKSKDQAGNEIGPWATHPEEMFRKVPIRRLAKRLPLSAEFMRAGALDDYAEAGVQHADLAIDSMSETAKLASEQTARELAEKYAKPALPSSSEGTPNPDGNQGESEADPSAAAEMEAENPLQASPLPTSPVEEQRRTSRHSRRGTREPEGTPLSFQK